MVNAGELPLIMPVHWLQPPLPAHKAIILLLLYFRRMSL
jgi:hypothetical protein